MQTTAALHCTVIPGIGYGFGARRINASTRGSVIRMKSLIENGAASDRLNAMPFNPLADRARLFHDDLRPTIASGTIVQMHSDLC